MATETTIADPFYSRGGGNPLLFDQSLMRRALQVVADLEVTAAARKIHDLAEVQRNGGPMGRAASAEAWAAWTAWNAGHRSLVRRLAAYRSVFDDDFRPVFQRPVGADVLDAFRLGDDPEVRALLADWARSVDAAAILGAGYIDGQRALPAFISPDGMTVLAFCGHRWNEHGNAEGPRTPHCRICLLIDEAPERSGYYVVPVDDPDGWRLAHRGFRHRNNGPHHQSRMAPRRLLEWRQRQDAMARRGLIAPVASPRPGR